MNTAGETKRIQTLVIGGGQAGLSIGYYLKKRSLPFLIIDANPQIGDAWRNRWDSLRLFTPARYCGLPGLPFPGRGDAFRSKDDMADYLQAYAKHFELPVLNGIKVDTLTTDRGRFVVTAGEHHFEAENVVVAMANYQTPKTPLFAKDLDKDILQLTAHNYRNPSQLREGGVLVVGAGNSGADISVEVARTHATYLSGTESGHVPFYIDTFFARHVLVRIMRFIFHHILTVGTPIGRKLRPKMMAQAAPLVRVKPQDLINAGIQRVSRVVGVQNGLPLLSDKRVLDVKNVIWCTGFNHGFPWIKLPVFDKQEEPLHERGVTEVAGLYFVGLHFLYSMTSATLFGIGRDARRVVKALHSRVRAQENEPVRRLRQAEVA
jgi:putative flavoprotein involved in K+ transport